MVSQIDPTVPVFGAPTTQSVRTNFQTAANEISVLQQNTTNAPFLPLAGGRMTAPMWLYNDPTDAMQPATKGYVDAGGGGGGGGGIPEAPVDGAYYARTQGAWAPAVPLIGGTMTGLLILSGDATNALGAVTLEQLNTVKATILPDAPNDANYYGRHANAWASVLSIGGGNVTGSLAVGSQTIPTAPAPYTPTLFAGSASLNEVGVNSYLSGSGARSRIFAGPAMLLGLNTTSNLAVLYVAATGAAGSSIASFIPALTFDTVVGSGFTSGANQIPTDAAIVHFSAGAIQSGNHLWNAYYATGGIWKYLTANSAALINQGSGTMNFDMAASGAAGATISFVTPLQLTTAGAIVNGVLNVSGAAAFSSTLTVTSTATLRGATYFGTSGLFTLTDQGGSGSRFLQFASNYYLGFGISNSITSWITNGNVAMQFSAGGNMSTQTVVPLANNQWWCGLAGQAWYGCAAYSFANQSDPRLKKDMTEAAPGSLAKVLTIPVKAFRWLEDSETDHMRLGWDASEVQKEIPRAVIVGDDDKQTLALNLSEMIATLWQAIQELAAERTAA